MKKNILSIILLSIILIGTVSAFSIGEIITQEQVNSMDFDTMDLRPSFYELNANLLKQVFIFKFRILDLKDNKNGTYTIQWQYAQIEYPIIRFTECILQIGRAECISKLRTNLIASGKSKINSQRIKLNKFKRISAPELNLGELNLEL